jgi:hypothetical protein
MPKVAISRGMTDFVHRMQAVQMANDVRTVTRHALGSEEARILSRIGHQASFSLADVRGRPPCHWKTPRSERVSHIINTAVILPTSLSIDLQNDLLVDLLDR